MPMRELMRERAGEGTTRVKRNESERHEPGPIELAGIDRFALAPDLNNHDLGTAARVERDAWRRQQPRDHRTERRSFVTRDVQEAHP